ncbi:hypothetical protein ACFY4C_39360 [Actinomadura viridis]|uniref:hypothetical protein n=1 Tax=Actinomadura viridis TaxID=58110 RepID=UPI00369BA8A8
MTTLREITAADATTAIALRSLFQALKRERVIFRNPTRNLPVGDLKGVPRSVPADLLAGLLDETKTPLGSSSTTLTKLSPRRGTERR